MSVRPRVVFSPFYEYEDGNHIFATRKFSLAAASLGGKVELISPSEPERSLLELAHDPVWVEKVISSRLSPDEEALLELRLTPAASRAHRLAVSGTLLAARHALEKGIGLHCGGGAHHAFRARGEGYCALNDLAIAALALRAEGKARRVAVVDLDAHQGNGTASILAGDSSFFTFSMHNAAIYPGKKEKSALDENLVPGTGDAEYFDRLNHALKKVMDFKPDLVLYQAGVDPWEKDLKGGLALTERGLLDRDNAVREACLRHRVPVAVTLGGGYGPTPEDTAKLHARTLALFAGLPIS